MNRQEKAFLFGVLVLMGAGWGIAVPLTKIAVSTGHGFFGLIFWQSVIGAGLMAAILLARGIPLRMNRQGFGVCVIIGIIGTVIPDSALYSAIKHLPSGVLSVLLSLVPVIAFPIALGLGLESFNAGRLLGLLVGLGGVVLLILPELGLSGAEPVRAGTLIWLFVAMLAAFFYAFEGNYVAKWGTAGLNPVQVLFGASLTAAILTGTMAVATGQFVSPFRPWGAAEWALVASSVFHVLVYAGFVWLVGQAGAVFATQVSYLVTGFGIFWAMVILKETYSPYFWAAMGLMLVGVFLVQPRKQDTLAPDAPINDTCP